MAKKKSGSLPIDLDRLPSVIRGTCDAAGDVAIIEAAAADGKKLKKISGVAYNGGAMSVGYGYPVTLDLSGITASAEKIPALKDHDPQSIVGHLSAEVGKRSIKVDGELSGDGVTEAAAEVSALSANGFPWQMSVGVAPTKVEFVERGGSEIVNGRKVEGPAYIVRAGKLNEVSFVAIGADSSTSGRVAASIQTGADEMNPFDKWLEASGFDKSQLSAVQIAKLEAAYKLEATPSEQPAPKPVEAVADPTNEIRAKAAAEMTRINAIQVAAKDKPEICAKAIAEGWDATKTELEVLRASRPTGPAIHSHNAPAPSNDLIECALSQSLHHKDVEKRFKPETLQAAHTAFRGRLGLRQALLVAACANGMPTSIGATVNDGNLREVMEYAFGRRGIQAGFSTVGVSSILENVANKSLLEGYMENDQSWRMIAEVVSLSDFKDAKAYRLLDSMEYEELGAAGEIKHGTVGDETITRSVDTYAKMFALTRKQIINDDLNAFQQLPRRIAAGASQKFNTLFWTAFINNSSFFTAGLTNYISGATTTLLTDGVGLGLAIKAFRQMTSPTADGAKSVGNDTEPTTLLVPPELEGAATALYAANNLSNAANGSGNIYFNRFKPVVQRRLSNSSFTGYSTTAWYLFGGSMLKPMWAGFLNGNESPTVESADADFDTLGIQFRGYFDAGAGQNEYLAGIKSKGAA